MAKDAADDRRRYPRARQALPVRLSIEDKGRSFEARVTSFDVSLTGMFLASEFFLKLGVVLEVEFRMPSDDRQVRVTGVVVREVRLDRGGGPESQMPGFAIHFSEYHDDSRVVLATAFLKEDLTGFIDDYLARRSRRPKNEVEQLRDVLIAWELGKLNAGKDIELVPRDPLPKAARASPRSSQTPAPKGRGAQPPKRR